MHLHFLFALKYNKAKQYGTNRTNDAKPAALIKKHNSTKWQPKAGSFMNNGKSMAPVDLGLEIQRGVEN